MASLHDLHNSNNYLHLGITGGDAVVYTLAQPNIRIYIYWILDSSASCLFSVYYGLLLQTTTNYKRIVR